MSAPNSSVPQDDDRSKEPRLLLGLDGGGSKTAAWIAALDSQGTSSLLGRGMAGASNLRAVGKTRTLANLDLAVEGALQAAKLRNSTVDYAVLALAGSGRPDVQAQVSEWVERRCLATRFRIVHDAEPVLTAGTPEGWGVALIVGTGSAAIGVDQQGNSNTVGGWGHWFGDEGSGFDLGRKALAAVAKAVDQVGPDTMIVSQVLEELNIQEARQILQTLSSAGDVRRQIAALAPLVLEACEQQDGVAQSIVENAVAGLATLVEAVTKNLTLPRSFPMALAGGVACGSHVFRDCLKACLEEKQLYLSSMTEVNNPVEGCLKIAQAELIAE